ncbi:MAG: metallophosphoesterase [Deltaproteobacteria bacterium]|nr:metallophosphoesterase [Deltaproteobacteria bacterium]
MTPDSGVVPVVDAGATPPDGGTGGGGPSWFVHVTDTHFGSGNGGSTLVTSLLEDVVPVVDPDVAFHTGDITDNGGHSWAWSSYREALDTRAPAYPRWLEIPGNHDVKDDGAPNFLAQSNAGRAGAGLYGHVFVDTPRGRVRVLRTNTADSANNFTNIAGVFGEAQQAALLNDAHAAEPAAFTIVLGHHPVLGPERLRLGSDTRMLQILERFQPPLYFCGHVHTPAVEWTGNTLMVQGRTFGKEGGDSTFMLAAVDDSGPRVREVPLHPAQSPSVDWPLVMITLPADHALGGTNPRAGLLPAGAVHVRALAFAPSGVTTVETRVDQGPWQTLTAAGRGVFRGVAAVSSSAGQHRVEVRAAGNDGTSTDGITVVGP